MRLFVVLALVAAALAEPEADPTLVYTTAGLHAPLTSYPSTVYPTSVYPTLRSLLPTVNSVPTVYTSWPNSVYPTLRSFPTVNSVPAFGHLVKRDAEAEAEADPLYIDTSITGTGGIGTVYPTSVYPTLRSFPVVPTMNSVPTNVVPTVNSVPTNVVPTVNSVPTVCFGVDCVRRNIHTVNRVVPTVNRLIPTAVNRVIPTVNRLIPTAVNRVIPTINRVIPTVNRVIPTVNRIFPTVNRIVPTVNTVIPTWMSPVARSPMPGMDMADTMKTETDAGDVVVA